MFYQLPHVPVSPISSIDPLHDLFPEESPTSISKHPPLVYEFPPFISNVPFHVAPKKYPRIFIIKIIIYSGYNWANLGICFWNF